MSFLAPLYGLAALAIALPVLFHLVRKRPKEIQPFSSLMFLEPAPPRLTRHSRIEQWLLLLLRALAIGLLAIAFTRPYWNAPAATEKNASGLRRMILIDSSASMRREGLMDAAKARAEKIIQQSSPTDIVSVYSFDRTLHPLASVEETDATATTQRQQLALNAIRSASPSWFATDLGAALASAADLLQADSDANTDAASESSEIIVVTDFQSGTQLEALAGYTWPATCKVRIERVDASKPGNARATLLGTTDESKDNTSTSEAETDLFSRIRIVSQSNTSNEQFQLSWLDANGVEVPGTQTKCSVPNGSAIIVRMPLASTKVTSLKLVGDSVDFDNQFFLTKRDAAKSTLLCIDAATKAPEDSLGFFLEQLPLSTASRSVQYQRRDPGGDEELPAPTVAPLIVASQHATLADLHALGQFAERGGSVLYVLDVPYPNYQDNLKSLFGRDIATVSEASIKQYAMLERIDFKQPLLMELSGSRFNDFTRVRFWKHRNLELLDDSKFDILARFDNGSPALVRCDHGKGSIWLLTAGWQPNQSQLALSSKFVPILANLFRISAPQDHDSESHLVGDTIVLGEKESMLDPQGDQIRAEEAGIVLDQPGIYQRNYADGTESRFAVNLVESESQTMVADVERLERLGVNMLDQRPPADKDKMQRQLRAVELEAQQSWWRWLIVGVLGAIGIESLLCIVRNKLP